MTKLRSGRKTTTGGDEQNGAPKRSAAGPRKRAQPTASTTEADANEEEAKKFKKAKPSICKAAEELICPILQGLPIDPVVAADVSKGTCTYFSALGSDIGLTYYFIHGALSFILLSFLTRRARFTSGRRSRRIWMKRKMMTTYCPR